MDVMAKTPLRGKNGILPAVSKNYILVKSGENIEEWKTIGRESRMNN